MIFWFQRTYDVCYNTFNDKSFAASCYLTSGEFEKYFFLDESNKYYFSVNSSFLYWAIKNCFDVVKTYCLVYKYIENEMIKI